VDPCRQHSLATRQLPSYFLFVTPSLFSLPPSLSPTPHTHIHTQVAQRFSLDVREGDILVVATDGLFDNVYPDEAAALVSATKVGGRLCVLLVCAVVWGNRVGLGLLTWRMGD
jgi:serine/threonine protein phosphatase PrpC